MISRSLPFLAAVLAGWLVAPCFPASAQTSTKTDTSTTTVDQNFPKAPVASGGPTIVYQLTFSPDSTITSLNYQPYDFGWYVAPVGGGSGTMILTRSVGGVNQYFEFDSFGQLFVARDGRDRKAVITCTAAGTTSSTAFFAIGDASTPLAVNSGDLVGTAFYAPHMSGYAITAQSSLQTGTTSSSAGGVAGSSRMEVIFDDADTNNAAENRLGVAATAAVITDRLDSLKYTFVAPTTSTSTTTTTTSAADSTVTSADSSKGPGDLVVYQLSFSKSGESINFKPFAGGFFVTSASAGQGSLIIETSTHNSGKVYKVFEKFGSLFVIPGSGSEGKAVLFAMDVNSVSSTSYFAMGDASQSFKVNSPSFKGSVNFARKLRGYAISADSAFDLAFLGDDSDAGVGGVATLSASYAEDASKQANKELRTVADEVKELEKHLESDGYTADSNSADQ